MRLIASLIIPGFMLLGTATALSSCGGSNPKRPDNSAKTARDDRPRGFEDSCTEAEARGLPPPAGCPQQPAARRRPPAVMLPDVNTPQLPSTGGLLGR